MFYLFRPRVERERWVSRVESGPAVACAKRILWMLAALSRLKNKHTHKTDVLAPISSARLLATRRARILPYIHATVAYVHMRYDTRCMYVHRS